MNILVIGGAGPIGTKLESELRSKSHDICLSDLLNSHQDQISKAASLRHHPKTSLRGYHKYNRMDEIFQNLKCCNVKC